MATDATKDMRSLLVHGNEEADPLYHTVNTPIYLSSTFQSKNFGGHEEFGYSRGGNPTRRQLESLIAELEGGRFGFAFSSGMTATAAALSVLQTGEEILVTRNVYGGTLGALSAIFARWGISFRLIDTSDLGAVRAAFRENTKAVFLETPSNPVLDVADIAAIAAIARERHALTIVDNTFLSPYLQQPLTLGADIVVESATKYLSGHSDIIAGVAAASDETLAERLRSFQILIGGIIQPFDAYILLRSIKTLSVRLDRQIENAQKVARFLKESPAVDRIRYPGLPEDPGYAVNARQAIGPGAMLSFLLNGEYDIKIFFDALDMIVSGASLGGVETLISGPIYGSHRNFSKEQLEAAGITETMVRLSIGIEDAEDIIADLRQAFEKARRRP
ncbi:MAG: PLP-dependent aspartate aminotransferase family protein [Clostridiales Family XIII bacterium]|jgi:cystathionine beta-lyase|nr:PLP-dependent aspartate aminotransferase family protein [Clostridiales Family XIII bacterium]